VGRRGSNALVGLLVMGAFWGVGLTGCGGCNAACQNALRRCAGVCPWGALPPAAKEYCEDHPLDTRCP
jgi:hypothetical protein